MTVSGSQMRTRTTQFRCQGALHSALRHEQSGQPCFQESDRQHGFQRVTTAHPVAWPCKIPSLTLAPLGQCDINSMSGDIVNYPLSCGHAASQQDLVGKGPASAACRGVECHLLSTRIQRVSSVSVCPECLCARFYKRSCIDVVFLLFSRF